MILAQGKRILGDRWPFLAKTGNFGWPYRLGLPRAIQKMGIFGWFNTRGREYAFALDFGLNNHRSRMTGINMGNFYDLGIMRDRGVRCGFHMWPLLLVPVVDLVSESKIRL